MKLNFFLNIAIVWKYFFNKNRNHLQLSEVYSVFFENIQAINHSKSNSEILDHTNFLEFFAFGDPFLLRKGLRKSEEVGAREICPIIYFLFNLMYFSKRKIVRFVEKKL